MFELDLSGGERYELTASSQEGCGERFVSSLLCSGGGSRVEACIEVTMPPIPLPTVSLSSFATLIPA